ncbi:MAG: Rpn family recombination-promoting nuclease/putative transposase [Prevotellaceae bacterium]|nr:Rpn family recombination-promoting nuclease/putative transposase [Prevotellaceae bacterium]
MARYLDPKNDLTFKRVFGEHKHLCMSLINSMMPFDASQQVVSIEYLSGELPPHRAQHGIRLGTNRHGERHGDRQGARQGGRSRGRQRGSCTILFEKKYAA